MSLTMSLKITYKNHSFQYIINKSFKLNDCMINLKIIFLCKPVDDYDYNKK